MGQPNAGKSTLLNLLAGFDRAIVTPVAGTTRDVVEQAVQLGDVRLNLFDTAGLRQTEDAIEAEGIRRSWKKLDEAGLILAVFDGSERPTREDLELAQRCAGRPAIALVNKEDKPPSSMPSSSHPILRWCCRSAVRKRGAEGHRSGGSPPAGDEPNRSPRRQPLGGSGSFPLPPAPGMPCPVRWTPHRGWGWMLCRSVWTMRWTPSVS